MPNHDTYRVPLTLLMVAIALEALDLDFKVMEMLFDNNSQSFPLRHHWFTEGVIHTMGRQMIGAIGLGIVLTFIASFTLPSLKSDRREWSFVLISIVISTLSISTLKATTGMNCAYDLSLYGGSEPLNQLSNLWLGDGQCWPGGHVSGPLSLIAVFFGFRTKQPYLAFTGLIFAVTMGIIFGLGQTLRGAHFPSHTIWTALIIWMINLGLMKIFFPVPTTPLQAGATP